MADSNDLMNTFDRCHDWIESGRFNGDEGAVLKEALKDVMTAFSFGSALFEEYLKFANANSPLGWMGGPGKVGVKFEVDDEPEEVWAP
jgi:hypothetical protein